MVDSSVALRGRGDDLNAAFGLLQPTFADADRVVRILDSQRLAVRRLIRDGGIVFDSLRGRNRDLAGLIESSEAVFSTTARRDSELERAFIVLPTFEEESRLTLERLDRFAAKTNPVVTQLRPAARHLTPVLSDVHRLTPHLTDLFVGLRPVIAAAPTAFPALRSFLLDDLPPLLGRLDPFFAQVDPLLEGLSAYKHEIAAFLANAAAATNAVGTSPETSEREVRYLRTAVPLGPDSIAVYPRRLTVNRTNPYLKPLGYQDLGRGGLKSFETSQCGAGLNAVYRAWSELSPGEQGNFRLSTNLADAAAAQDLYERLRRYSALDARNTDELPAPPCIQQGLFRPLGQPDRRASRYQHVFPRR
jgi:ABC-type transporter Mla subunit MlaD